MSSSPGLAGGPCAAGARGLSEGTESRVAGPLFSCPLPSCPLPQTKQPAVTDLQTGCLPPRAKGREPPTLHSRQEGDRLQSQEMRRCREDNHLKKPSSPGSCNPAKIEVQGHSVCVAITASCNPEQITYLCLGSLGSKNRGNNSTDHIRLL